MKFLKRLTCAMLVSFSVPAAALQATLEYGYDSNPYKISSPPESANYLEIDVSHKGKKALESKQRLQYSLGLNSRIYDDNVDADTTRVDGRIRWINSFKVGERRANLMVTGDVRSERRTYFSQTQRQVAETSAGDSLADRFDYDSGKLSAEFIYRLDKQKSVSLYSYVAQRNYREDYQSLGLESLDFNEYSLQPTFRYKSPSKLYVRAFVYHKVRSYDDLLNDDMAGNNLNGSLLEYQFNGYGLLLKKPLTESLEGSLYASGYIAHDDAEGFRDLRYHQLVLGLDQTLVNGANFLIKAKVYRRDYLKESMQPIESETGNAGRNREGYLIEAEYSKPLNWASVKQLRGLVKATFEHESNSQNVLSFDRHTLSVGLSYSF